MQFLNPFALIGLIAAGIPLAIHLLHRGVSSPVPFSNLRFLRQLEQSRMRRIRFRQWLALLLRTLIIALLVGALARPSLRPGTGWGGQPPPVAAVVLVDVSASTGYHQAGATLFAGLQRQAHAILRLLGPRDQVTLIPFADRPQAAIVGSLPQLDEAVNRLAPADGATHLAPALAEADRLLAQAAPPLQRELYLVTDLAQPDWPALTAPVALPAATRVFVSGPAGGERANISVDRVASRSWMPAAGHGLDLDAVVSNHSPRAVDGVGLDLYLDNEHVGHQEVSLEAGQSLPVRFRLSPRRTGRLAGFVELEDDALRVDNRRTFTLALPDQLRVLVVGQESGDTYYAQRALVAAGTADPVLAVTALSAAALDATALAHAEVVLLVGMDRLSPGQAAALDGFLGNGGAVLIFPGLQAAQGNVASSLLQGLAGVGFGPAIGAPGQTQAWQTLDATAPHHPLFDDLLRDAGRTGPRFFACYQLQTSEAASVWARLTRGDPAVVSVTAGRGRLALFAAPLALNWTDLPLHGALVPLLQRLVRELCLGDERDRTWLVGDLGDCRPPAARPDQPLEAEAPSGRRLALAAAAPAGAAGWRLPRLDQAGLWRLRQADRVVDEFAVNLDPAESVVASADTALVVRALGGQRVIFLPAGADPEPRVAAVRFGREVWREFLALAAALLLIELWVARAPRDRRTPAVAPP